MWAPYHSAAGQNLARLAALSDGIFAFAMTLLVLVLTVPATSGISDEHQLLQALSTLAPRLIPYFMTFMTLGIFWIGQQTQLNLFARADRNLAWIHIAFLLAVTLTPFSTALLAAFITFRVALLTYWLNLIMLGAMLFCSWVYAKRAGLIQNDTTSEVRSGIQRRIIVAQALYAFAAALSALNTYYSIALIIFVQLNYAVAPRVRFLNRL